MVNHKPTTMITMRRNKSYIVDNNNNKNKATDDNNNKKVRFGTVKIEEFSITVGDGVPRSGVPIRPSRPSRKFEIDLEYYEDIRPDRRHGEELFISKAKRTMILIQAGVSCEDIACSVLDAHRIRASRKECTTAFSTTKADMFAVVEPTQHVRHSMWGKMLMNPHPFRFAHGRLPLRKIVSSPEA